MDYTGLAAKFLESMRLLHVAKTQKNINEALQGESFVLQFLYQQDDDVLPGKISCEMNVSSARIAATLNKLEGKGLVTRRIDSDDRRKILVRLTGEGRSLAEEHRQSALSDAAKMLGTLGERDAREYVRLTKKLAETVSQNAGEFTVI